MSAKTYIYLIIFTIGGFSLVSIGFYSKHPYQLIPAIPQNRPRFAQKKIRSPLPFDTSKLEEFFECDNQEFKKDNRESALINYRKALATYPSIVEALLRLGKTVAKQDKYELKIIDHKSALAINPRHLATYLLLSRSLHALQKNNHRRT